MSDYTFDVNLTPSIDRSYRTANGIVRVEVPSPASIRVSSDGDPRDVPAFVELFFHDAFLIHNLADPGSFGGAITPYGGDYRVHEMHFDPWLFVCAHASKLPLADVAAWYESLALQTQQIATSGIAKALFHILHLARSPESDLVSILRLSAAAKALFQPPPPTLGPLLILRDAIANHTAPVVHPMHDDALDSRLDDPSFDWTAPIDAAAQAVIGEIQRRVIAR